MSRKKLPPGPPRKCLIGNMSDLDPERLHISFTDISETYGEIFSVEAGGKVIVVVNTIEAFRELYEENKYEEKLDGREETFVSQVMSGGMDIPLGSNTPGRKQRRDALHTAISNVILQQSHKLQEEIGHLVEYLRSMGRDPQNLETAVQLYLTNAGLTMLTGERYDYTNSRLLMTVERANIVQGLVRPKVNSVLTKLPCLRHLPFGYGTSYKRCVYLTNTLKETIFDPAKTSFDKDALRGGIDHLLKLQTEASAELAGELTDDCLSISGLSTVSAGTAVAVGNLLYFIVVILHQPEVVENLRKEMDSVLGRSRLPTLADRPRLGYAQAVILELFRWVSPAPLLVPRRADEDVQFRGYTIPKDATVITNAWKILHDETKWERPWEFRPQRFLTSDGILKKDLERNVIAFGGGNRKCAGVQMGTDLAFLFVTTMVHQFDISSPGGELPTLDPHFHSTSTAAVQPEPFEVIVKPRPE